MALGDGIRRNVATITDEERSLLINAIRALDSSALVYPNNVGHEGADASGNITYWDMMEQIHKDAHVHGSDVHTGPGFIPWHRAIVNHLEKLLRMVDSRLSLHYWDWTTDPRVPVPGGVALFTPDFMGSAAGDAGPPLADFESTEGGGHTHIWRSVGTVQAKPSGAPDLADDATMLSSSTYTQLFDALKGAHDVTAHSYIGGTITQPHYSFHDPFVFLLHSNLDRLWAMWQRDPSHPERLNPATAYGSILADKGYPANYFDELVQPWAGVDLGGTSETDLNPWRSDAAQRETVSYLDPSIIIPASYDTAPHSSFIVTDRDTFSSYEVESSPNYPRAFYVIYDGFSPNELGAPAAPAISFHYDGPGGTAVPGMSASLRQIDYEDPARAADLPQRITYTFDLSIGDSSIFSTFTETRRVVLLAALAGALTDAALSLIKQPNPYLVDGPVSWLSTDLRVFQIRPGGVRAGILHGNPDTDGNAPYTFIQSLLAHFNATPSDDFHPFRDISTDQTASQLELSRTVGGVRVCNYAVAKVRYRANALTASQVKIFFRQFSTMVSALDYDTSTNYRRADAALDTMPLLGRIGSEIASIPFFAQRRIDSATQDMSAQLDDANRHDIAALPGQESVWYFGCWLDFNQTEPQFPPHPSTDGHFSGRQSILQLVRGHHQCLVAEIYFQPGGTDPIQPGATPASSDHLAQRNLAITESDNPGNAATHTIQHTFRVKPSLGLPAGPKGDKAGQIATPALRDAVTEERLLTIGASSKGEPPVIVRHRAGPDELMIDWNNVPRESKVSLYFPEWNIDEVLSLAALHPRPSVLEKLDPHTLGCKVADVTYIPVPGGRSKDFAGLLSLVLPPDVVDGQVYSLVLRQYSGITRKVLGSFQLTIPVRLGEGLLRNQIK